jgi:hypothetical protein
MLTTQVLFGLMKIGNALTHSLIKKKFKMTYKTLISFTPVPKRMP